MPVTVSGSDPWKERIIRTDNPLDTYLDTLLDEEGSVTSRYDHTYKIYILIWNLSIESKAGARQTDVVKGMIDYCAANCKLDEHKGIDSIPETWTNAGTVRTKTKQILKRLVDVGIITKSEDKSGEKNPDRVFYHPHIRTYIKGNEILPEFRGAAINRLKSDNFELDRALAMTRHFLYTEGKWDEFLQWYENAWNRPFPEFKWDSLGVTRLVTPEP